MPDIQQGGTRWSLASARVTSGVPLRQTGEGSGQAFLETALAGTGRFRPQGAAQEETTLALCSNNTELAKRNTELEKRCARNDETELRNAAFQEE